MTKCKIHCSTILLNTPVHVHIMYSYTVVYCDTSMLHQVIDQVQCALLGVGVAKSGQPDSLCTICLTFSCCKNKMYKLIIHVHVRHLTKTGIALTTIVHTHTISYALRWAWIPNGLFGYTNFLTMAWRHHNARWAYWPFTYYAEQTWNQTVYTGLYY